MRRLCILVCILGIIITLTPARARAQVARRCFPEVPGITNCIEGRFLDYWQQNGGLQVFGYPISAAANEQTAEGTFLIQYFERNRFELHPEKQRPYDVLLGRLGDDRLKQLGRSWFSFPTAKPGTAHYFAETGHAIAHRPFWDFWSSHGLELDGRPGKTAAESLALFGMPLSEPATETNAAGDAVRTQWFERARLEDHGAKGVLLGLLGSETRKAAAQAPTPGSPRMTGIWTSAEELAQLPMRGGAWDRMKATADGDLGTPKIADLINDHDVKTLAVALVYARTGETAYRQKAAEAIRAAIGTEAGGEAIMLGRNLVSYVIAADLIKLREHDSALDGQFRQWLSAVRTTRFRDGTLISEHERRANNHGTMPGASRAAIAVYLGDTQELARTALVFKGWVGDREAYARFSYTNDRSWQANPEQPVAINPRGAVKDGRVLDGALPEEMRRGCALQWPPCPTGYPWEALQGSVVQAMILARQGYDVWNWQDRALLRAVTFLQSLDQEYGGWWAGGDDRYVPWIINHVYDTDFPTGAARFGKNMGWTDWMYPR